MNKFEQSLSQIYGQERLRKIQGVKIGLAGAGGLGSNCAQYLVRSGFKNFVVADFDRIDYSNLNRQFFFYQQVGVRKVEALKENLLAINPDITVNCNEIKLEAENIKDYFLDCHAIIEALDDPRYKRLLVESFLATNKLVVAVSGLAGWGNTDDIITHRVRSNFFMVGDMTTEAGSQHPPVAPGVAVAAAKQADVVLSYFLSSHIDLGGDHY